MGSLVKKDQKNRLPAGSEIECTHFLREVDERGRIIFTPQVLVPKDEYDEKFFLLSDSDRDRFVETLLSPPERNKAFVSAKEKFNKKYR